MISKGTMNERERLLDQIEKIDIQIYGHFFEIVKTVFTSYGCSETPTNIWFANAEDGCIGTIGDIREEWIEYITYDWFFIHSGSSSRRRAPKGMDKLPDMNGLDSEIPVEWLLLSIEDIKKIIAEEWLA